MDIFNIDLKNRIFGLDILRALAIFLVVCAHGKVFRDTFNANGILSIYNGMLSMISVDGVSLFFVLSGFLIGRILLRIYFKEGELEWKDLWGFWVRRWFRTVPPYFIMLTILIAFQALVGGSIGKMHMQFYLFIQNLWYAHPPFFPEAWSLSVEEWFYLTFPFLLFVGAKALKLRSRPMFLFVIGIFILLGMAYRTYVTFDAINQGVSVGSIYGVELRKVVVSRVDSMMFGVLAAYIYFFHRDYWEKTKALWFFIGICCFMVFKNIGWHSFPIIHGIFSFTLVAVGTFAVLPVLNSIKTGNGLFAKFIVMISLCSYSMYLVNLSMMQIVSHYLPPTSPMVGFAGYAVYWLLVIIVSVLAYQFIERPILKFRDKLYKKQSI